MAYKQNFGPSRMSGYKKTEQVASKSSLFRLGSSPLNHDMDFDHEHEEGKDRYTRQVPVKPGTKRQKGSSRRKLSKEMANFANTRDADGEAVNTQGYMRGGSGSKVKVGGKNLLEVKTGTRGGGGAQGTSYTDKKYDDVNWRDINKQIKKTGSASVVDGKVSSGTTQTKTAYGSVSRDNRKKEVAAQKAKRAEDLKNKKATRQKTKDEMQQKLKTKRDAAQAKRDQSVAELVKRRKEQAANRNKNKK